MSLNLVWKNCNSKIKADPFAAGVTLMAIGLNQVTERNLPEAEFRIAVYTAVFGGIGYSAEDLIGLESNVGTETASKWLKRIHDCAIREGNRRRTKRVRRADPPKEAS